MSHPDGSGLDEVDLHLTINWDQISTIWEPPRWRQVNNDRKSGSHGEYTTWIFQPTPKKYLATIRFNGTPVLEVEPSPEYGHAEVQKAFLERLEALMAAKAEEKAERERQRKKMFH